MSLRPVQSSSYEQLQEEIAVFKTSRFRVGGEDSNRHQFHRLFQDANSQLPFELKGPQRTPLQQAAQKMRAFSVSTPHLQGGLSIDQGPQRFDTPLPPPRNSMHSALATPINTRIILPQSPQSALVSPGSSSARWQNALRDTAKAVAPYSEGAAKGVAAGLEAAIKPFIHPIQTAKELAIASAYAAYLSGRVGRTDQLLAALGNEASKERLETVQHKMTSCAQVAGEALSSVCQAPGPKKLELGVGLVVGLVANPGGGLVKAAKGLAIADKASKVTKGASLAQAVFQSSTPQNIRLQLPYNPAPNALKPLTGDLVFRNLVRERDRMIQKIPPQPLLCLGVGKVENPGAKIGKINAQIAAMKERIPPVPEYSISVLSNPTFVQGRSVFFESVLFEEPGAQGLWNLALDFNERQLTAHLLNITRFAQSNNRFNPHIHLSSEVLNYIHKKGADLEASSVILKTPKNLPPKLLDVFKTEAVPLVEGSDSFSFDVSGYTSLASHRIAPASKAIHTVVADQQVQFVLPQASDRGALVTMILMKGEAGVLRGKIVEATPLLQGKGPSPILDLEPVLHEFQQLSRELGATKTFIEIDGTHGFDLDLYIPKFYFQDRPITLSP